MATASSEQKVIVVDFGAQYGQLIARRVRDLHVYSEIVPCDVTAGEVRAIAPAAIILSGGPASVYAEDAPSIDPEILKLGIPVLGFCYGQQIMAVTLGGEVGHTEKGEYGPAVITRAGESALFDGTPGEQTVWMSHRDAVSRVPEGFVVTAKTDVCPVASMECAERKLYATQYHPEVRHTPHGNELLSNFLFGIWSSVIATAAGLIFIPSVLRMMNTPDSVMPHSLVYFRIYFAGVFTVILYNVCMSVMRALGDSLHPLYYLIFSSVVNMILDLIFVAGFQWSAAGAAVATVIAQGLSVLLCMIRMVKDGGAATIHFKELRFNSSMIRQVITQGLPTGLQNSVISVGNLVVQSNINTFGAFAISGQGAFAKLEGIAFLPIMSMSMALTTFVSQNLGAGKADRAKKGSVMGVAFGMAMAELVGICLFIWVPILLRIFVDVPEAIEFGTIHGRTVTLFFLLAFSNCATGVLRGVGKSIVPMFTMLICWCGIRVLYVTIAIRIIPVFRTISSAYPLTWTLSSIIFIVFLLRMDWDARV